MPGLERGASKGRAGAATCLQGSAVYGSRNTGKIVTVESLFPYQTNFFRRLTKYLGAAALRR
jgi:hypothetical protein